MNPPFFSESPSFRQASNPHQCLNEKSSLFRSCFSVYTAGGLNPRPPPRQGGTLPLSQPCIALPLCTICGICLVSDGKLLSYGIVYSSSGGNVSQIIISRFQETDFGFLRLLKHYIQSLGDISHHSASKSFESGNCHGDLPLMAIFQQDKQKGD